MRRILFLLLVAVLGLVGCNKDDEFMAVEGNPLVGRWIQRWTYSDGGSRDINYWAFRSDSTGYFVDFEGKTYEEFRYKYVEKQNIKGLTIYINSYTISHVKSWVDLDFFDGKITEMDWCKVKGDSLFFYNSNGTSNGEWARTNMNVDLSKYKKVQMADSFKN